MASLLIMGVIGLVGLMLVALIDGSLDGLLQNKIQNKFIWFFIRTFISSVILEILIYFITNKYFTGIEFSEAIIYGLIAVLFMYFAILTGGEVK